MSTSAEIGKIAEALSKAQGEMKNPEKNKTAKIPTKAGGQYSYNYADLPSTFDTVRAVLSKNGLSHTSSTHLHDPAGPTVLTVRLMHASGQWIESGLPLAPNSDPKLVAASMTYYRRYLFNGLVGISGDDDIDNDVDDVSDRTKAPVKPKPVSAGVIISTNLVSEPQIKRMFAIASKTDWKTDDIKRLISNKYGLDSTKKLTKAQYDDIVNTIEAGSPTRE